MSFNKCINSCDLHVPITPESFLGPLSVNLSPPKATIAQISIDMRSSWLLSFHVMFLFIYMFVSISSSFFFFFFFCFTYGRWNFPGIKPASQQRPNPLQWQRQILNTLCQENSLSTSFKKKKKIAELYFTMWLKFITWLLII